MNAYERISNAMSAVTCCTVTDTLQSNTADALIKLAQKHHEAVGNLFNRMVSQDLVIRETARMHIKHIATHAQCGLVLAYFDYESGFMDYVRMHFSQQKVNKYVTNLFAYSSDGEDHRHIRYIVTDYFSKCDDCGEWECDDEFSTSYGGNSICRDCRDDHYTYSSYYGEYVHNDSSADALDRNGDEIVIHCDDDNFHYDDDEDMYVHRDYNTSRVLGKYHSSKGKFKPVESAWTQANCFYIGKPLGKDAWEAAKYQRFFGVELEIEVKQGDPADRAEAINDRVNNGEVGHRCFFEQDSSISHGFEIVTQPMGLDNHALFWQWVKDPQLSRGLLSHNTSTCGLHIHVTKAGLTKMQISKVIAFINHPDNKQLIETVARRYNSSYAQLFRKKLGTAHRDQNSRYEAVNMEPGRTVEFRLFRGTLKYESMMSAIEFVNALLNFCHDQSGYGFDLTTKSFMEYIEKPVIAHDTKHLRPYLINKLESQ